MPRRTSPPDTLASRPGCLCAKRSGGWNRFFRGRERGLTLAEVLIATAILAVAAVAVTKAVATGHQVTYAALNTERAVALAEALMDEILAKPVTDPEGQLGSGPDDTELVRADFDNTDDYDGYVEAMDTLADLSGTLYPDSYQRYQRSVTVTDSTITIVSMGTSVSGYQVVVEVTGTDSLGNATGLAWRVERFVPVPEDDS